MSVSNKQSYDRGFQAGKVAAMKEVRDAIGGCRRCKYMNDITKDIWIYCDSCRNRLGCLGLND